MTETYRFKTTPYAHQKRAIRRLLKQGYGGALLMEPRTGKTKTTIDWLSILYQKRRIDRAVIVCPTRVMGTWAAEFHAHSPRPVHLTVWDRDERKAKTVPRTMPGVLNVLVVNYEAFATPGGKTASGRRSKASGRFKNRALILKWLAGSKSSAACVLDESHKIKSASGKASNMLVAMSKNFKYRAILTGTPITKAHRAFDVYMQWAFLNPDRFADLPTVGDFKDRYGRWTTQRGFPQYLGPRNLPELHSRMAADAVIVRRDQCFDLPPREDIVRFVDLSKATRAAYDAMAEEMIAEIESGVFAEASIKLVQNLRLSQLTSGFVTADDGSIRRLGMEKANVLEELLTDRFELEEKVVVAARYKYDLDLIEGLGKMLEVPVWSIRGGMKRTETDEAIVEFRKHEGAGLIVLQPQAASLGIDLSTASHMVWYSHTPSWVNFSQCCDRIALSRTSTTFTHLVARHSIDEVLLSTLADDGDLARAVMTSPDELLHGKDLDLDEGFRLKGMGTFQFNKKAGK